MQGQAGGGWALDEAVVFGRYDLFAKRCRKLISLFTTIHQFTLLAQVPERSLLVRAPLITSSILEGSTLLSQHARP